MLFSIITVCLNPGGDLEPTVASVLSQDFGDYELLIKDGGSSDGTEKRTWSDPRVRFYSSSDKGIFDAMNQALGLARGQYVNYLNAGDTFVDGRVLSDVASIIRLNTAAEFFYGNVEKPLSRSGYEIYPNRLSRRYLFMHSICHQGWFVRRETYLAYGGFETQETDCADCRLLLRMLVRDRLQHRHLPRIIVLYKGGGSSANPTKQDRIQRYVDAVRREVFSPLEYAAFQQLSDFRAVIKRIAYNTFGWRIWQKVNAYRIRRRHCYRDRLV